MARLDFMEELRSHLQMLPFTEQQDALRYYEEYFDDTGPENEQKIMEELGTPEEVAKNIIANSSLNLANPPIGIAVSRPREASNLWGLRSRKNPKRVCGSFWPVPVLFGVRYYLQLQSYSYRFCF